MESKIWIRISYLKITNKQKIETDHGQGGRLVVPGGTEEGVGWMGNLGFGDANCYIWNGWAMGPCCTAQGNVCDWVTLLYNGT